MPFPGRVFAGDEELGKRNDDHRPKSTTSLSAWLWATWNARPRMRRRRVGVFLGVAVLLYLFFKNIPTTLTPISRRIDVRVPGQTYGGVPLPYHNEPPIDTSSEASTAPPRPKIPLESEKYYYNGPVKFYSLAVSLHAVARTMGHRDNNKNVLFAAGSLQSASRLLPMACEMSRWNRNSVHFSLMGRDDISMEELKELNGIGKGVGAGCDIIWHGRRSQINPLNLY